MGVRTVLRILLQLPSRVQVVILNMVLQSVTEVPHTNRSHVWKNVFEAYLFGRVRVLSIFQLYIDSWSFIFSGTTGWSEVHHSLF